MNFPFPVQLDETIQAIRHARDMAATYLIDHAVDEFIKAVFSIGGEVIFMENGQLEDFQRMSLSA